MITLSMITVSIAIGAGPVLVSNKGSVSLLSFESFYIWTIMISISLWEIWVKKNANITIILSILTYIWTWYLANEMIEVITEVKITMTTSFYIYLSSAIFLIMALFFNNKNKEGQKQETTKQNLNNNLNENNFIFTNFITGIKEIPLNTTILLVNNIPDNSFDLIYNITNNAEDNKIIKCPTMTIKNITYDTRIKMQSTNQKPEENYTKSILLSAVMFGGTPLLQLMGNSGFNFLFNSLSGNYDKVNYNTYYEITIETIINNQDVKLIVTSEINPEEFIKQIKNKSIQ